VPPWTGKDTKVFQWVDMSGLVRKGRICENQDGCRGRVRTPEARSIANFSGSKAFDFPAQYGLFPVRGRLEVRCLPAFGRKFRSKAERDRTRHILLKNLIEMGSRRDKLNYRA
jgi:hypothetical protein